VSTLHPAPPEHTDATIDIFIPYWGDPGYMKETIRSVLAQTSPGWHLTIVDDAYPGTVINDYVAGLADDRITYIRKAENGGITENYRTCISLATRELTALLGCDDRMLPDYVEKILQAHEAFPMATVIQPGVRVIDESGREVRPLVDRVKTAIVRPRGRGLQLLCGDALAANLLRGNWLYWPSLAFRTDRLTQVPLRDGYDVTQDIALILDMIFSGDELLTFTDTCFEYRRHSNSASSLRLTDGSRFAEERAFFRSAAATAQTLGWWRSRLAAIARLTSRAHAITLIPRALGRADLGAARTLARHGLGS